MGAAPTILNAANEVAVGHFLAGRIGFLDIATIVEQTLEKVPNQTLENLDDVDQIDAQARQAAETLSTIC